MFSPIKSYWKIVLNQLYHCQVRLTAGRQARGGVQDRVQGLGNPCASESRLTLVETSLLPGSTVTYEDQRIGSASYVL